MSNPIFNYKEYSITDDSITIGFESGPNTFAFRQGRDTLYIKDSSYVYKYMKLHAKTWNEVDRIKFNSLNPGWGEKRYFFDLTLNQDGVFRYGSKSEERILEGRLKEKYVTFIFDKLHNIELPIRVNSDKEEFLHHRAFTLEVFVNEVRVDRRCLFKVAGKYFARCAPLD